MKNDADWNKVYTKNNMTMWEPQQTIVQFVSRHIKKRIGYDEYDEKREVTKILDIGCGNASAVHFFAKQGFEAYGIDISSDAISIGKNYLQREGLQASLVTGSCDDLPYDDDSFDAITCYGVLDHVTADVAAKAMKEILRVLKKGGLLFVSLCSTESSEFMKGKKMSHHTYSIEEGMEKGQFQHYFDAEDVKELFFELSIIDVRHGRENKFDENFDFVSNNGRWFITAIK